MVKRVPFSSRQVNLRKHTLSAFITTLCFGVFAVSCANDTPVPSRRTPQPGPNVAPATARSTAVEDAIGTELMQKSVARVLGFVDVGNTAQTIFQDTESSLYESIATKLATPNGTSPDPIFYYSPAFIAGIPKLLPLADGRLNVTIPNQYTQQAVRQAINEEMADTLAAYKIQVEKIGLIPMENVKVTIRAFGKTYSDNVEMDKEFTTIVFSIPAADVPQLVIDGLKSSSGDQDAGQIFMEYLSLITIDYDYFVQQYGKQECRMSVSNDDIRNMYMNQDGCPPGPSQSEIDDALAWVSANGRESAADSTNSKLAALLRQTSTVTACAAGKEARKLQSAASVSCTKGGTRDSDQDGTTGYSPMVIDFLKNTIEPTVNSLMADPRDISSWSDELMAAVIQMFGSPERFRSVVDGINSEILNKESEQVTEQHINEVAWFTDQLRNHDVFNQADTYLDNQNRSINEQFDQNYDNNIQTSSEQNSKSGGGGLNLGFGGFGVGFGSSSANANGKSNGSNVTDYSQNYKASDEFARDYRQFHETAQQALRATDKAAEDKRDQLSQSLYAMGYDHSIENIDGTFNIYPKLNLAIRADESKAESFANRFATNELGNIVQETEQIPVQLTTKEDAELVMLFKCSASAPSWTLVKAYLTTYQWWRLDSFWEQFSKEASDRIQAGGCSFLSVRMFYRNAANNLAMIPSTLDIVVNGVIARQQPTQSANDQGTNAQTTTFEQSAPIIVTLKRSHNEERPVDGAITVDAGSDTFTSIQILQ